MMRRKDEKKKNNKGFSLVELIVVIAIMAVLVAVLAPQFTKYVDRSRQSNDASTVSSIVTAAQVGIADTDYEIGPDTYTITVTTSGTTVDAADATNKDANIAAMTKAIEDACGKLNTMKRTAKKWEGENIVVTITVESEGTVTVDYTSPKFAEYIKANAGDADEG